MTHDNTIDFNARRGVKLEDFDDIYDYAQEKADENDRFRGHDLNAVKMERLNAMREVCRKLAEADDRFRFECVPFSNRERNGSVMLTLPSVALCDDRRVLNALSDLFRLSDIFIESALGGDLRLTFSVHDMWDTWSLD